MSNVSLTVLLDHVGGEGLERFNLTLNVPSSLDPAITAANRDSAVGVIIDSTSK